MEKVNQRIIKMRNVWRLSEEKVASELNIPLEDYKKLESGKVLPSMEIAMNLCKIFKITLDYLMTGVISEKDKEAINRPLTKEERISDIMKEVEKKYSEKIFKKYYKYLYAIYVDRSDKVNGIWLGNNNGTLLSSKVLELDDYNFFDELCKNGKFDLHYEDKQTSEHIESSSIFDVLGYDRLLKLLQNNTLTDEKFIDMAIKEDPIKTLNYYFLQEDHISNKKGILKCLKKGAYVEKCINIHYYYDDEDGSTSKTYEFGKDVLATMLLKEYCEK